MTIYYVSMGVLAVALVVMLVEAPRLRLGARFYGQVAVGVLIMALPWLLVPHSPHAFPDLFGPTFVGYVIIANALSVTYRKRRETLKLK